MLHDPVNDHDVVVYSAAHHHGRPLELSPAMGLLPELFVSVTSLTAMSFLAALVLCGHRESRRGARGHRGIPLASAEPVLIAEGWSPTGVRPGEDEEAAVEEAPMLGRAGGDHGALGLRPLLQALFFEAHVAQQAAQSRAASEQMVRMISKMRHSALGRALRKWQDETALAAARAELAVRGCDAKGSQGFAHTHREPRR